MGLRRLLSRHQHMFLQILARPMAVAPRGVCKKRYVSGTWNDGRAPIICKEMMGSVDTILYYMAPIEMLSHPIRKVSIYTWG